MEIGDRIKFLRENIGLNLTELAKRASIAKSTLHKIEENKTNPTINTIWAIAKALGVSFGELIDESGEIKEKGVSVNLIERGSSFESYKMKLSKGSYYVASPHFNGIKEQIVVLEGVVLVGDLKDPKLLASKSSFEFIANVPHIYKAIEEALLVVTLFFEKKEFFFYEDRFIDVLDKEIAQNFMEELIDGIEIIRVFPKEIRSFNIDGLNISETKEGVFLTLKRDKIFFKEGVEFRKD
ncbi:MAG: helix-turn-helix transcriptional regulator, partial [Epsilonproteobacteria bacterium]|nr:helix-turn-helix transcriptional regulator [Campylobacterota bacterium]